MIKVRIRHLDEVTRRKYLLAEAATRLMPGVVDNIAEKIAVGNIRAPLR